MAVFKPITAQIPCATPNKPAHINVVAWLTQEYIDHIGNAQQARSKVKDALNVNLDKLSEAYKIQGYHITFHLIFMPSTLAPAQGSMQMGDYTGHVSLAFKDSYPCVPADIIVIPRPGSGHGFGEDKVAIIPDARLNSLYFTAHELGHVMGLVHTTSQCIPNCDSDVPPFMCSLNNNHNSAKLSNCDRNDLNNPILPDKCAFWTDVSATFVDSFSCTAAPDVAIVSDQPYLLEASVGCTPDRTISNYTVTINGGQNGASLVVRVTFNNSIFDITDLGPDFTDILVNGSVSEMRIIENGQEKVFNLAPFEQRSFNFQSKFDPSINPTVFNTRINAGIYNVPGFGQIKVVSANQKPFSEKLGTIDDNWVSGEPILVTGNLTIKTNDPSFSFFWGAPLVVVKNNAQITIASNTTVEFDVTQYNIIEGCNFMWRGFQINPGATIRATHAAVKDAQFGINASSPSAKIHLDDVAFINNNYGVRVNLSSPFESKLTIKDCSFTYDEEGFKPFNNLTPAPEEKSFCGVYLNNVLSGGILQGINTFSNLKYGVLSYKSNILVSGARFYDIGGQTPGPGYIAPLPAGKAIYAAEGRVSALHNTIVNAHTGIEARLCAVTARHNDIRQVETGIFSTGGLLTTEVGISSNTIEASRLGISAWHTETPPGKFRIDAWNTITLEGEPGAVGISAGAVNFGDFAAVSQPRISGNILTMADGGTGILADNLEEAELISNTIESANSTAALTGIKMEGGDYNYIADNSVIANAPGEGILGMHSSRSDFHCNLTQSIATGLRFEGMLLGRRAADIAGNTMTGNNTGLLLGPGAMTGPQIHRANKWSGSFSGIGALNLGDAFFSQFKVDPAADPRFLPPSFNPQTWFIDETNTGTPFLCAVAAVPPVFDESAHDFAVISGTAASGPNADLNNWIAQRRLYEKLTLEGNPYTGNTAVDSFLTAAQTNGLAAYTGLRLGIRAAMGTPAADALALVMQDSLIRGNLESLEGLVVQAGNTYDPADSLALAQQIDSLFSDTRLRSAARDSIQHAAVAARQSAVNNLLEQNAALPAPAPWQQHEKVTNEAFLQSIGKGTFQLDSARISALTDIAWSCPLSDGEPVFEARALLAMHGLSFYYDDDMLCSPTAPRGDGKTVFYAGDLSVYPNPAATQAEVRYRFDAAHSNTQLTLFDLCGRPVSYTLLPGAEGVVSLELSSLPAGMYWYRVSGAGVLQSGKIVVSH